MKIGFSVIIPFYNEEDNVAPMLGKVSEVMKDVSNSYEILAIDDGSRDSTFTKLKECRTQFPNIKIIKFRGNFGQTQAMQAGIDHAKGNIIITMDGDLQNDPTDIPRLLDKMKEGYEVVSGWRKNRKDNILRCIPSKMANLLLCWVTGINIHDNGCSLKVYKSSYLKNIRLYSEMHRFIVAFAFLSGAKIGELVVKHHPRTMGKSKYGFSRIWKVFLDLFTLRLVLNFSERPLVWFGTMGLTSLFISLILLLFQCSNWTNQLVIPGLILLFGYNAFVLFGYGLASELAVKFGRHINLVRGLDQ